MQRALRQRRRRARSPRARRAARRVRHAGIVAVAATGLILTLLGARAEAGAGGAAGGTAPRPHGTGEVVRATEEEARGVASGVWSAFVDELPRVLVALAALAIAWVLFRAVRWTLRRLVPGWSRANALTAVVGFAVWVLGGGVAISVIAGDIRGMLGSVGLVGLALSWALQTPIESITGWLLLSFRGYYRVGDRIAVGEIQGDVHRIDVLTTTLWEIGGGGRGPVRGEQPTGRIVTIPNHEILTGAVVNFTRDFPWLWDEVEITVAPESDLALAARVVRRAAEEAVGDRMRAPAIRYGEILRANGLEQQVPEGPEVYLAPAASWTTVTVRYLVPTHERRQWKSELTLRIAEALDAPAVAARVFPGYPRMQWQRIDAGGRPRD